LKLCTFLLDLVEVVNQIELVFEAAYKSVVAVVAAVDCDKIVEDEGVIEIEDNLKLLLGFELGGKVKIERRLRKERAMSYGKFKVSQRR